MGFVFPQECFSAVQGNQGHSRSLSLVPIESAYARLFSKYSDLHVCNHGTRTSQTEDGQTDRQSGGQTDDILWHKRVLRIIAR